MKVPLRLRRLQLAALEGGPKRWLTPSFRASVSICLPALGEIPRSYVTHTTVSSRTVDAQSHAGPSNYATRPKPPHSQTQAQPEEDSIFPALSDFFTSHRPRSSNLSSYLSSFSNTDIEGLKVIRKLLLRRRHERDSIYAANIWRRYAKLSPATRLHLNQKTLQNILRAVVPSAEHLKAAIIAAREEVEMQSRSKWKGKGRAWRGGEEEGKLAGMAKYGERLLRIMRDMEAAVLMGSGSGSGLKAGAKYSGKDGRDMLDPTEPGPRPSDYRFVLLILGRMGDVTSCESLATAARVAGRPMDIRMIDSRLCAVVEWLRDTHMSFSPMRASRVTRIIWAIMGDMAAHNLTPRNATMTLLIQAVYLAKKRTKVPDVIANLDVVLEDVFKRAYGVNMASLPLGEGVQTEKIKGLQAYALVDYWGRKGDVWKMFSAYEVLMEQPRQELEGPWLPSSLAGVNADELRGLGTESDAWMEEGVPTLSGSLMQEAENRRGMSIFGMDRKREQQVEGGDAPAVMTGRGELRGSAGVHSISSNDDPDSDMADGASLLSRASSPNSKFSKFYPALPLPPLTSLTSNAAPMPSLNYPSSRIRTETISILIRHARASRDPAIMYHILASALSSIIPIRNEWLSAVQYRHARTNGHSDHPEWFVVPDPRVAVHPQWFWDVERFLRKLPQVVPIGMRRKFQRLICDTRDHLAFEQRVLEKLIPSQEGQANEAESDLENVNGQATAGIGLGFDPSTHLAILKATQSKVDMVLERHESKIKSRESAWIASERRSEGRRARKEEAETMRKEAVAERKRKGRLERERAAEVAEMGSSEGGLVRASGEAVMMGRESRWTDEGEEDQGHVQGQGHGHVRMIGVA